MKSWNLYRRILTVPFILAAAGCPGDSPIVILDDDLDAVAVIMGGNVSLALRAGSTVGVEEVAICDGWFPAEPQNTLTIASGLGLTIRVIGGSNARLWVLCGQSNFCGEETAVGEWEISRFWNTGVCEVYVGTAEQDAALAYELEFEPD
jgi:hypothetical protein